MSNLRLRRLTADYEKLRGYVERHPRLTLVAAEGNPPERYHLEYAIRSVRQKEDDLEFVTSHKVEIVLPRDYPRTPPQCRMLTPVFHPNIAPHAICVGDHWSAGEPIASIVARIGEMIAYQSYNTKSPLNGEAARWVEKNMDQLPLDAVSMVVDQAPAAVAPPPTVSAPPVEKTPMAPQAASDAKVSFACAGCGARYVVLASLAGKRGRCKQCQAEITIPALETTS